MLKADSSRSRMPRFFNERQSTKSGLQKEVRKMNYTRRIQQEILFEKE
jgi:hypothetical protein